MYNLLGSELNFIRYLRPSVVLFKHNFSSCLLKKQPNWKFWVCPRLLTKSNSNGYFKNNNYHFSLNATYQDIDAEPTNKQESIPKRKMFTEFESEFHHKVLENSSTYSNTIFKADSYFEDRYRFSEEEYKDCMSTVDWESKSAYNVATSFISLGVFLSKLDITINDEEFDNLVSAFVKKSHSFTDDQLMDCLIALQFWPISDHVKAENFLKVWKSLDDVCYSRYADWTVDKTLFMMDLWYQIKLIRLSMFVYKGLNKVSRRSQDLTGGQLIQTLFYMSCVRKLHPGISMREYEYHAQKHITQYSIEEIGIIAVAFFKTTTPILDNKLLLYIMQRTVEDIDEIPSVTATAITKTLRLSHKPEIGFTVNDLVNKFVEKRMDSLNLINAIHILHLTTQVQFYNEEAITKLAEKFCSDPSAARLKDIERVAFILSLYNFIPPSTPDILDIIVAQLDRPEHVLAGQNHPLTLLSLIYFLTLLRVFPEKHIQQLLSAESIAKTYKSKYTTAVQVVQIDYNRVLEGPSGSEHLLSPSLREYLARRYSSYIPDKSFGKMNFFYHMMLEVMDLTKEVLGGDQYSMVAYTLPHSLKADIIFHLDEDGKPVAIPEEMRKRPHFEDVLRPPDPKGWYCVVVGGRNLYMHNVSKLIGEQVAKLRQLRLLGYTPIMIPAHYWKGEKDKAAYLKLKYFTRNDGK